MTRVQEMTSQAAIAAGRREARVPSNVAIAIFAALLIGLLIVAYAAFASPDTAPATSTQAGAGAGAVTDGWLSGVESTNQRQVMDTANRTTDGWSSALVRPAPEVVDGWAGRYLAPDGD